MTVSAGISVPVSVLLPLNSEAVGDPRLARAWRSLLAQTLPAAEIVVVLNGADASDRAVVERLADEVPRGRSTVRIIEMPACLLAAALNRGLREARHELVARMDGDDDCDRRRVEVQAAAMMADPSLVAVGSAYRVEDSAGRELYTVRPPTSPTVLHLRMLVANTLCHGSMMLRRGPVLAAGGYDETIEKAQDYELWLRLLGRSMRLGCVPEVLYTYAARERDDSMRSSAAQSEAAGAALMRAWRSLPRAGDADAQRLTEAMTAALRQGFDPEAARRMIGDVLAGSLSLEALTAWCWSHVVTPPAPALAHDAGRRARVREIARAIRAAGATSIWLFGAGVHTGKLLEHTGDLGMPLAGLVDDACVGETRHGVVVRGPDDVPRGGHVLLSSDWHEQAMWDRTARLRARGVVVWRLYGNGGETG